MSKTKDLKSGTKLPLMNLKGKDYLQVAHRLVWFREEHPMGKILTEVQFSDETRAVVKATVSVPDLQSGAWLELSSSHKSEQKGRFADFLEKAETGAIGRALAVAGYGTQFEPEFDEEDRIVDSPMPTPKSASKAVAQAAKPAPTQTVAAKGAVEAVLDAIRPTDREGVNKRITAMSNVILAKAGPSGAPERAAKAAELKALVASKGAETKEALTDAKAAELLRALEEMANG